MSHYDTFTEAIDEEKAVYAVYDGGDAGNPRKLLPYVLGQSDKPDTDPVEEKDMVLCYEYTDGDPSEHPTKEYWRCFEVDLFDSVTIEDFTESWEPIKMTGKQRNRQNCVQEPDTWRRGNQ